MNELIEEIQRLVQRIQDGFTRLIDIINDVLSFVPPGLGWIVDRVRDAFAYLERQWNSFWDNARFIFGNMGDLGAVEDRGARWVEEVGAPVSEQKSAVSRGLLEADDHWQGQAAGTYFQKAGLHETALGAVQGFADTAAEALDGVRAGLMKFYGSLIVALGALIGGLIGAAASSATIFGIPAGIFIAAGACIAAELAFLAGALLLRSDCDSAQSKLRRKMNDRSAFPGGEWPPGAVLTA